jgi:hypothetical protein
MFRGDGALGILDRVPSFLIESYLPEEPGAIADALARARRAALGHLRIVEAVETSPAE